MTATLAPAWTPLLEGTRARTAWDAVQSVAQSLAAVEDWDVHGPSLSGGSAGAALFFGYLAKATDDASALATCRRLRKETARMLAAYPIPSTLFSGFAGIGWTETRLTALLEPDAEDPAEELDEALLTLLDRPDWNFDYDLISGLVGYGVYGLERLGHRKGRAVLERALGHLEALAEPCEGGLTWFTRPDLLPAWQREYAPEGYWNLGLAHGVPGCIALLGRGLHVGVRTESCRRLLEGAVAWLQAVRNPEGSTSSYATQIPKGVSNREGGSRVAWCYGDLGLAAAYAQAGHDANRPDWVEDALQIARACARRPREASGVVDAGICHGSAGNALIFHRFHAATGEAVFRQAALDHLDWTLAWRDPAKPFGGFPRRTLGEDKAFVYQYSPGMLEGACGVALVLLAALVPQAPDWDRHLLVSIGAGSLA